MFAKQGLEIFHARSDKDVTRVRLYLARLKVNLFLLQILRLRMSA